MLQADRIEHFGPIHARKSTINRVLRAALVGGVLLLTGTLLYEGCNPPISVPAVSSPTPDTQPSFDPASKPTPLPLSDELASKFNTPTLRGWFESLGPTKVNLFDCSREKSSYEGREYNGLLATTDSNKGNKTLDKPGPDGKPVQPNIPARSVVNIRSLLVSDNFGSNETYAVDPTEIDRSIKRQSPYFALVNSSSGQFSDDSMQIIRGRTYACLLTEYGKTK